MLLVTRYKRIIFILCFLIGNAVLMAQNDSVARCEIEVFQNQLNKSYKDTSESPLLLEDFKRFLSLDFFPIDLSFRVKAILIKDSASTSFGMQTSTLRKPKYRKYGDLEFIIHEQSFRIPVYQNIELISKPEYKDYLFFPFTDLTNNDQTYGGGRYLDLKIPPDNILVLDFNQCYQPYCAYNHKYSCPIPPPENFINLRIEAGVRDGFLEKNKKIR